jgi:hypothetical protein
VFSILTSHNMGRVVVVRVSDDSAAVMSAFVVAGGIGIDNPGGGRAGIGKTRLAKPAGSPWDLTHVAALSPCIAITVNQEGEP